MENNTILSVLKAANGEIIGRIRTQKIFYLLEQLGLNSGFKFSYHHYGPYSETLSTQIRAQSLFGDNVEEINRTTDFGTKYSIYKLKSPAALDPEKCGNLEFDIVRALIQKMKSTTSVVIELAATIHWLKQQEEVSDWKSELIKRKASKATDENIQKAKRLLADVGLGL